MIYIVYLFIFYLGAVLGSFLNVVVERTHRDEIWWKGRSYCENCKKNLNFYELIPIFSFLFQKGKCRNCKIRLSIQYVLVEILSGIIFLFFITFFKFNAEGFLAAFIFWFLLGNFIADLKYMELLEILSIPAIFLSCIFGYFFGDFSRSELIIGIAFGFLFFFLQFVLTKGKGIGSGDIRLGVIIGGILGWPLVLVSIFLSYIFGSIISLSLIVLKKAGKKTQLPLGVFLIPVLLVVFIFQKEVLEIYNSYFNFSIN